MIIEIVWHGMTQRKYFESKKSSDIHNNHNLKKLNNANSNTTIENVHEILEEKIQEIKSRELNKTDILKNIRIKNKKGLVIAYLNINSIRKKIEPLKIMASKYVDIPTIPETKIDETFKTSQFMIEGCEEPFRKDRNKNGGGLLIHAREGILVKDLKNYKSPNDIETCTTEVNLRKKKWLLVGISPIYRSYIAHPPNAKSIS